MSARPRPRLAGYSRFEDRQVVMPKFRRGGDLAWALYTRATLWANLNETDGAITEQDLPDLMPEVATGRLGMRDADGRWRALTPLDVVDQAVTRHLLDPAGPGTWQVHDFLDWNLARAERAAQRGVAAALGRAGGTVTARSAVRDPGGRFARREPSAAPGGRPSATPGRDQATSQSPPPTHTPSPPPPRGGVNAATTMTTADLSAAAQAELAHPEPGPEQVGAVLRRLASRADAHD